MHIFKVLQKCSKVLQKIVKLVNGELLKGSLTRDFRLQVFFREIIFPGPLSTVF
jgi:hypothetical protein